MPNRLESLDWLRGLMALSVMLYHFGGRNDAATPLGKLGIYGVSIFLILSGLSMGIAYDKYVNNLRTSVSFFVRRLFRIWPLLWLAIALVAVPAYFSGSPYSGAVVALNLFTLFGFSPPADYINMGAWSIGNEMVYNAFTPIFIASFHWRKRVRNVLTLATFAIGVVFAFYILNPASALGDQWVLYVNPFNNLFLYCAGLAVFYDFRNVEFPALWRLPILVITVALFFLYPSAGDQINIVTGVNRIAMSLVALAIVVAFYKCPPPLPGYLGNKLEQLGIATYGVYLLHPIVLDMIKGIFRIIGVQNNYLPTLLAIGVTVVLARLTFRFFESPLTKLGKRLTQIGVPSPGK